MFNIFFSDLCRLFLRDSRRSQKPISNNALQRTHRPVMQVGFHYYENCAFVEMGEVGKVQVSSTRNVSRVNLSIYDLLRCGSASHVRTKAMQETPAFPHASRHFIIENTCLQIALGVIRRSHQVAIAHFIFLRTQKLIKLISRLKICSFSQSTRFNFSSEGH